MQNYITIMQASELTGKHKDTIRRLVKQNSQSRHIIKDKKKGYLIDKDWLVEVYAPVSAQSQSEPLETPSSTKNVETPTSVDTSSLQPVIEALVAQLQAKDSQIEKLQHIIIEKESNTTKLQDQFQQLLLSSQQLPAKATEVQTRQPVVDPQENAVVTKKPTKKTTSKSTKKSVKQSSPKSVPPKKSNRGWFRRNK